MTHKTFKRVLAYTLAPLAACGYLTAVLLDTMADGLKALSEKIVDKLDDLRGYIWEGN